MFIKRKEIKEKGMKKSKGAIVLEITDKHTLETNKLEISDNRISCLNSECGGSFDCHHIEAFLKNTGLVEKLRKDGSLSERAISSAETSIQKQRPSQDNSDSKNVKSK